MIAAARQLALPALALLILATGLHMADRTAVGVTAAQSGEIVP